MYALCYINIFEFIDSLNTRYVIDIYLIFKIWLSMTI